MKFGILLPYDGALYVRGRKVTETPILTGIVLCTQLTRKHVRDARLRLADEHPEIREANAAYIHPDHRVVRRYGGKEQGWPLPTLELRVDFYKLT